jgi:hypothetical protein
MTDKKWLLYAVLSFFRENMLNIDTDSSQVIVRLE